MDVLDETNKKMQAAVDHFKQELKGLRTGRANPALVENVMVEVYGTKMRLHDMASISVPESRKLLIAPFDAQNVHAIAKGIEAANLNLRAVVEGNVLRILIPEMSEAIRKDMVKEAHRKCEETKISIRNIRRDANEKIKKLKANGDIPEDLMKKQEKKIQEATDKFCKVTDELAQQKEKEILTV